MYELVFLSGARAGEVVALEDAITLGRSPECDCEVPDPNASRRHATVTADEGGITVEDLGSANGSFVNEERFERIALQPGDILRLGETRLRLQHVGGRTRSSDRSRFGLTMNAGDDASVSMSMSLLEDLPEQSEDLDKLQQRLKAMIWVSEALASIADLRSIYGPILDVLFDVFPQADRGFILLGDDVDALEPSAMRNRRGDGGEQELTVSRSLCAAALERKSVLVYKEGGETDFDQGMSLVALNIRSAMVVPLVVKGEEVLGLLIIDTTDRRRSFNQEEMAVAAAVGRQIAGAINYAQLQKRMQNETENRRNLMRFLPKPVVDQAMAGAIDLNLGGQNYHGTIFFADVVGFTRVSEELQPDDVVAMMNQYFDRMVPCIEVTGGAIDKFMGDAVMAFWGIPFNDGRCALHAIQSGLAMQNAIIGFNAGQARRERPQLQIGIGLNTGPVVAGHIGSQDRLEYTVLGDTVNTAQRIEARACYTQVLVSEATWETAAGQAHGFAMPPVLVKNKADPVRTYSVRGIAMPGNEILLHLPLLLEGRQIFLIRRLSDRTFIVVHPRDIALGNNEARFDAPECPDRGFGPMQVIEQLPMQAVDGGLIRSLVQVPDATIDGLLGDEPQPCAMDWDDMPRARV
ncbi:MAG: adenylate/guanylate cyclase domain-containing protein [Planctomycetota bacterium]